MAKNKKTRNQPYTQQLALPAEANKLPPQNNERDETPHRNQVQLIFSRAVMAYLLLFLILGFMMSTLGLSPLSNDGFMPKALLLFVGLAVMIALANTGTEDWFESGRSWRQMLRGLVKIGRKP